MEVLQSLVARFVSQCLMQYCKDACGEDPSVLAHLKAQKSHREGGFQAIRRRFVGGAVSLRPAAAGRPQTSR